LCPYTSHFFLPVFNSPAKQPPLSKFLSFGRRIRVPRQQISKASNESIDGYALVMLNAAKIDELQEKGIGHRRADY
jgi:hypothetical protein